MSVSIVTPAYNGARYLAETIESVLSQSIRDWELIVVDDGSTDETASIVEDYARRDPRIRLIQQERCGVSAARNRGISQASMEHPYIAFLDADDVWEERALESLLGALDAHPSAVAAHGLARHIDQDGNLVPTSDLEAIQRRRRGLSLIGGGMARVLEWPAGLPTGFAVLVFRCHVMPPGIALARKEAVRIAGGFDEALAYCEDLDFWLRLSLVGDFAYVPSPVVRYRVHDGAVSRDQQFMQRQLELARIRALRMPGLDHRQRQMAVLSCCYWQQYNCRVRLHWAKDCWHRGEVIEATKQIRHLARSGAQVTKWSLVAQALEHSH